MIQNLLVQVFKSQLEQFIQIQDKLLPPTINYKQIKQPINSITLLIRKKAMLYHLIMLMEQILKMAHKTKFLFTEE